MEKAPQGPGSGIHNTAFSCENLLEDQPQRRDLVLGTWDGRVLPVLPSHPAAGALKVPSLAPPFFLDSKPHIASFPMQGLGGPRIPVGQLGWLLLVLIPAASLLTQPPETRGEPEKGGACSRADWVPVPATTFQGEGGGSERSAAETLTVLEAKQTPY